MLGYLNTIDADFRALTHDESKAHMLRERGFEVIVGDFSESETLGPALEGVGTVFLLTPIHPE